MIDTLATEYTVCELCEALSVSRSGYYAWRQRKQGARVQANQELARHIMAIHETSRKLYGSPRITRELKSRGMCCGHNRVARIMRNHGVKGVQRGRFRPKTTDSRHNGPIAPNRLERGHVLTRPNQVWVTDITYIPTEEGWMYLAAFMDLKTRAIKGWTLNDSLHSQLVEHAFLKAIFRHKPEPGLIVHSDRGVQYTSAGFRQKLNAYNAQASMSRRANCYDNAAMESFWATLKAELRIEHSYRSKKEARIAIFDYIETFYNAKRLHSAIGYKSPDDFEAAIKKHRINKTVSVISG